MKIVEANNKLFLDSNIILYALGDEELKRSIAFQLLQNNPYISTQVVNECSHVLRRKAKWPVQKIVDTISDILQIVQLIDIKIDDIRIAWSLSERYKYSHYDSLIIASALRSNCTVLYSEDLNHTQRIGERLVIMNPFITI